MTRPATKRKKIYIKNYISGEKMTNKDYSVNDQ